MSDTTVLNRVVASLREHFPDASVTFTADGNGGGTVLIEPVDLGPRYSPRTNWLGGQLTAGLPFSDVYPLFIGAEVVRADTKSHQVPISSGHTFAGRAALQVSRRTNNLLATADAAALKFIKVLHFIRELAP